MAELKYDTRTMVETCLAIARELKLDWISVRQLCETLSALDLAMTPADFTRFMKAHNQEASSRDANERANRRGYFVRQFIEMLSDLHEVEAQEEEVAHGHDLNGCGERFIEFLSGLDPDYKLLIGLIQQERGFDAATTIASMCSYVLFHRLHMAVPRQDLFDIVTWSPEMRECEVCSVAYRMSYPGQPPVCLNAECGREYHRRRKEEMETVNA